MINVEILKKELLKQDSVESCFNDEYREMMACIAGAVDCSIEKIERFLTDYGRLTRINQMTYVSREHETKLDTLNGKKEFPYEILQEYNPLTYKRSIF